MSGGGADDVGEFEINGRVNQHGEVSFVKKYIGQHSIYYLGAWEGDKLVGNYGFEEGFHGSINQEFEIGRAE